MNKPAALELVFDWGMRVGMVLVGASIVSMAVSCAVWLWRAALVCGVGF